MRILLVTTRPLFPSWRGNQLRTAQLAAWLATEHDVTVLVPRFRLAPAEVEEIRTSGFGVRQYRRLPWESLTGLLGAAFGRSGMPLQSGLYRSRSLARSLAELAPGRDLVIAQLVRLELALRGAGATPVVVDFVDSLSLNCERRAALDRPSRRWVFGVEARRLAAAERRLLRRAVGAWVVCERDRCHLVGAGDPGDAQKLSVLPIAVAPAPPGASAPGPSGLVLTGNLGYFPTTEGALWFLHEIWPRLRARHPGLRFVLAGSRPPGELSRLAVRRGAEIMVAPRDMAAVLRSATLAVAPLRAGSGVPIKVLEAWAAGVPVVTTSWAAAGTTGVADRDFLVADDVSGWVGAIERLLDDEAGRRRLVEAGRERLRADYDEGVLRARALDLVRAAVPITPQVLPEVLLAEVLPEVPGQ